MNKESLEELAYQIIVLLKDWQLWDSIEINVNGGRYASFLGDACQYTRGFRGLEDVWISASECNWKDDYMSCYTYPPKEEPVIFITCEGTALSDILCGKSDSKRVLELPCYGDKERIAEFRTKFFGLFSLRGIRCMPIGLYYAIIGFEEKETI